MRFTSKNLLHILFVSAAPLLATGSLYPKGFTYFDCLELFALVAFILVVIIAMLFVVTSIVEWDTFKKNNIFHDSDQVYKINSTSLLWTILFYYIYWATLYLPPLYPVVSQFLDTKVFAIFSSLLIGLTFIVIKFLRVKALTHNNSERLHLILFNLINAIIPVLIMYYILHPR